MTTERLTSPFYFPMENIQKKEQEYYEELSRPGRLLVELSPALKGWTGISHIESGV